MPGADAMLVNKYLTMYQQADRANNGPGDAGGGGAL